MDVVPQTLLTKGTTPDSYPATSEATDSYSDTEASQSPQPDGFVKVHHPVPISQSETTSVQVNIGSDRQTSGPNDIVQIAPVPVIDSAAEQLVDFAGPSQDPALDVADDSEFDHPQEDLKNMAFRDLQAERFEGPLKRRRQDRDTSTLYKELDAAVAMEKVEDQGSVLRDYTLAEWEEVGRWFKEQFAESAAALVKIRNEKRALAAKFESKIADYNKVVEAHLKVVDNERQRWIRSGDQVFTPKKGLAPRD